MADGCGKKAFSFEDRFYGSVTVGDRGQIVIPAEARKKYGIEPGDKLLVMSPPVQKGLMLCKIDDMREFMANVIEGLQRAEEAYSAEKSEEQSSN